ncbi:DUF4126 domain-containing protein [Rothia amarae]|uniref:DUF4126 domain-containing protein n=1 Tax=Rothia amarae TaxID=169480 RepID=UPI0033EF2406
MDFLTGTGLAASAGLNAYVPLLAVGLLDRFTSVVDLGPGYAWLSNGWVLAILGVLLLLEIVADKIPAIDSFNDMIQSIVRPTSGGIVFGSTAVSQIAGVNVGGVDTFTDPAAYAHSGAWISIVLGIVIALVIHLLKMGARPILNTASAGLAAPVVSTAEDGASILLVVAAIFLPVLVVGFLVLVVLAIFWVLKKRRERKDRKTHVHVY